MNHLLAAWTVGLLTFSSPFTMASPHVTTESSEDSRSSSTVQLTPDRAPHTSGERDDTADRETPVIRLGGNASTKTIPITFVSDTAQGDGTSFTMIPGDSVHSAVTIINEGGTDATLTGYVTDIHATTPTTVEDDQWFHEMQLTHSVDGSDVTAASLYDVIQSADHEDRAPLFSMDVANSERVDVDFALDFPITAEAGHEDVDRGFSFSMTFFMQDALGTPGNDAPDDQDTDPGTDSDDDTADGTPDGTPTNDDRAPGYATDNDTGTSDSSTDDSDENNPDIIAGFPGGNTGLAVVMILGGLALIAGGIVTARKLRGV